MNIYVLFYVCVKQLNLKTLTILHLEVCMFLNLYTTIQIQVNNKIAILK
jgi:hypothetical protein